MCVLDHVRAHALVGEHQVQARRIAPSLTLHVPGNRVSIASGKRLGQRDGAGEGHDAERPRREKHKVAADGVVDDELEGAVNQPEEEVRAHARKRGAAARQRAPSVGHGAAAGARPRAGAGARGHVTPQNNEGVKLVNKVQLVVKHKGPAWM